MRLIDADELVVMEYGGIKFVPKEFIDDAPTVDAVPVKHGRWLRVGYIENTWLVSECSACGYQTIDAGNYCTNCGAKMDGDDNGKT